MTNQNSALQHIVRTITDWREVLTSEPYNLSIKEDDDYILFKYNQITSDFSLPVVQEARGIILDYLYDYEIVCRPFDKFFNYGEPNAAEIDWGSAKVLEKIDGSILKLWYSERNNIWSWSTNGVISASKCDVPFPLNGIKTFDDMVEAFFEKHFSEKGWIYFYDYLDKEYTYIFEIVGPQNRVVVPYPEIELYLLAIRNNDTGFYEDDLLADPQFGKFPKPSRYALSSLEETLNFVQSDDFNSFHNEGFVVVDKFGNRIKIKTEEYLRIHRLRGEHVPTDKRILDTILQGETTEFLTYFPEYKERFDSLSKKLLLHENELVSLKKIALRMKEKCIDRKEFAAWATKQLDPSFLFKIYDSKIEDDPGAIRNYLFGLKIENLLKILGE